MSILPCRRNNYTKWKFFDLTSDRHYFKWVPFPQCKLSLVVSVTVYHFTKHDLEEIWGSQLALLLFLPICIWSENRDYFADPWTGFSEFQHIHICDCLRLAGDFPWRENQFLLCLVQSLQDYLLLVAHWERHLKNCRCSFLIMNSSCLSDS